MAAYSTSKAAVIGLAKAVGKEYAETNVTVNALAPAVIRTGETKGARFNVEQIPLWDISALQTAMVEAMQPEQVKYMTDKIPMKR